MASTTWIKVVGFSDVERHSLNTLIRLSDRMSPTFALWTPDAPSPPQVALIDMDSYEAGLELASPRFNTHMKLICVGGDAPPGAWRTLERPVDWRLLSNELSALFVTPTEIDFDISGAEPEKTTPPGVKTTLLVGMTKDERLYLRARLALAGLTEVDEAESAGQASELTSQRRYELAIVSLNLPDADAWSLVQALATLSVPVRSIIVTTHVPSWDAMEQAERQGCTGLLEIPFNPKQVFNLLAQV